MFLIALLLLSTQSFAGESLGGQRCTFEVAPANSGDFVDQLEKMAQDGCGTLNMMSMGNESYESAQNHARKSCCKRANKFIKKRLSVCSDDGRLRTKIELVSELCGNIDDGRQLTYPADVCYETLRGAIIDDPVVHSGYDQCQQKHDTEANSYGIEATKYMETIEEDDMKCRDDVLHARAKALPIEKLSHLSVDAANCPETRASDAKAPAKGAVPPISGEGATLPDAAGGGL